MRLAIVESHQFPELFVLFRERGGDKSQAMLIEWLEAQAQRGRIAIEDASATAQMLMDVMLGVVVRHSAEAPERPRGDAWRVYLRHAIRIFVTASVDADSSAQFESDLADEAFLPSQFDGRTPRSNSRNSQFQITISKACANGPPRPSASTARFSLARPFTPTIRLAASG